MTVRLGSEKGSFVLSPKNAFETAAVVLSAQLSIFQPGAATSYYVLDTLLCQRAVQSLQGTPTGPGQDWTFLVFSDDGSPIDGDIIRTLSFTQPPSVHVVSFPDLIAGASNCVEGAGENMWQAPFVNAQNPAFAAYDVQMLFYNQTVNDQSSASLFRHPNAGLPQTHFPNDWTPGPLEIV